MEQSEEIKTIKERNLVIKLSDADIDRICNKVGAVGLSLSSLIENFIGDLVNGTYSNGSDERRIVNDWFDRCWFGMFPEQTFLNYLIENDSVESFLEIYNEMKLYQNYVEDTPQSEISEEFQVLLEETEEFYNRYKQESSCSSFELEQEIKKVVDWNEQRLLMKGETNA